MATTQPAQHDSNSSHTQQASPTQASPTTQQAPASQEQPNMPVVGLAQDQVIALLKTLPSMYRVSGVTLYHPSPADDMAGSIPLVVPHICVSDPPPRDQRRGHVRA